MELEKLEIAEHEYNILLYMKYDKGFCAKMCSCLKRKHFNSALFGYMFGITKKHFEAFGEFPSKTSLLGYLNKSQENPDKFVPLVEGLENEDAYDELSRGDRKFITETVVNFTKHAKMKEAIIESYELLNEDRFAEINEKIQEALKFNIDVNLGTNLYDVDGRYLRLMQSLGERISTGFGNMDMILGDGWCRKEIYCVLGPPGMGKSIFLPNFGLKALAAGFNVVHYSLEMSEERVGLRYDGPATEINLGELRIKQQAVKKAYFGGDYKMDKKLFIKEFPTGAASVLDIEAHLEQLRTYESFVPDMIIVDYGDIMRAAHKTNNTYEEQGWIFRELRGLAIEHNCVVLTATQARRDAVAEGGGTKASVGMEQVADSMEKVRILDGLFSIVQSTADKTAGIIKLFVAKNRNGDSGRTIEFNINYGNMTLWSKGDPTKGPKSDETTMDDAGDDVEQEDHIASELKKGMVNGEDLSAEFGQSTVQSKNITAKVGAKKENE